MPAMLIILFFTVLLEICHEGTIMGILKGTGQTLNMKIPTAGYKPTNKSTKSEESAINSATGSWFHGEKIVAFEDERLFVDAAITAIRKKRQTRHIIC
jgi:hypothetical protein